MSGDFTQSGAAKEIRPSLRFNNPENGQRRALYYYASKLRGSGKFFTSFKAVRKPALHAIFARLAELRDSGSAVVPLTLP